MHINKSNLPKYSDELLNNNNLRVSKFLDDKFANRIYKTLKNDTDWGIACRVDKKPHVYQNTNDFKDLEKDIKNTFKNQINDEFQFLYNSYMMVTAYIENRDPNCYLNHVLEWLNSEESISYFKKLTQNSRITKLNAQATRYLPKHFLKQHNDENAEEDRLYAYVMGFTKGWNPDWGGLLQILNEEGEIVKTLIPEYNSLSIFKVPQNHFVSYVTPMAKKPRLSITGWLLSK